MSLAKSSMTNLPKVVVGSNTATRNLVIQGPTDALRPP